MNALVRASLVLGLGFGGFFDGIVLHQLLQWHHMICVSFLCRPDTVAELRRETFTDGLFHLVCYLVSIAGVVMLFRAARQPGLTWSGRILTGGLLAGWGTFNFVEGLIDHEILQIHHVMPSLPSPYWQLADMAFLASGLLLAGGGWYLTRSAPEPEFPLVPRTRFL